MNDKRRSMLMRCIRRLRKPTTSEECNDIKTAIEDLLNEEDDARDCMPESLQDSDRYATSEEASEAMQEAIDNLEDALSSFEDDGLDLARISMNQAIESLLQIGVVPGQDVEGRQQNN